VVDEGDDRHERGTLGDLDKNELTPAARVYERRWNLGVHRKPRLVARTVIIGGCRQTSTISQSVTLFPTGSRDLARMP
jgi:hypothetical protein